jgi:hypothetical protein
MHNRLIRGGILTSDRVNRIAADAQCEVFYRRLLNVADDFGYYSADPRELRAALYPLRLYSVTEIQIAGYLSVCSEAELIMTYEVRGKAYLAVRDFRQRLQRMTNKWPPPPDLSRVDSNFQPPEVEVEVEAEVEDEQHTCAAQSAAPMSGSSSFRGRKAKRPTTDASAEQLGWFDSWWEIYWLKKDRKRAVDAFCRHVKTEETFNAVMAATRRQSPEMAFKMSSYRPHGATWLDNQRWLDEETAAEKMVREIREGRH